MQRRNKIIAAKQSHTQRPFSSTSTDRTTYFSNIYPIVTPSAPPFEESLPIPSAPPYEPPIATLVDSSISGSGYQKTHSKDDLSDGLYVGRYENAERRPNIIEATPVPQPNYPVETYASCFLDDIPIVSNFEGKSPEVNEMASKNWHLEAEKHLNLGNFDKAIFYLNGAIFHGSTNPNLFNDRRQAHLDASDYYSALSKNEDSSRVPGQALIHKNISADYLGLALTDTLQAQSLDNQNPMIMANLATVLLKMEQFDRGLISIEAAIKSSSKTTVFKYVKAQILKSQVLYLANKETMSMTDSLQKETNRKIKDKTEESLQNYSIFISEMKKRQLFSEYPAQYRRALLDSAELYLMRGKGGFWKEDITNSMRFLENAENYEGDNPTKELSQAWARLYSVLKFTTLCRIETVVAESIADNTSLDLWRLKGRYEGKESQAKKVFKAWVSAYRSSDGNRIPYALKVKRYQMGMLGLATLNVGKGKFEKAEQRLSVACNDSEGPYLQFLFQERAEVADTRGRAEDANLFRAEASKF
ncbi:hypothetical protein HOH45_03050 [bacterium]|jgi:tetratricopeptide (TPR) repeat protein|nr:hypothetical protein [bacterium]